MSENQQNNEQGRAGRVRTWWGDDDFKRRRWIVSAAFLAAVVVLGVVVRVWPSGGEDKAATPSAPSPSVGVSAPAVTSSPSATAKPSPAAGADSACGLPNGPQTMPGENPSAKWIEAVPGFLTPTEPATYGPAKNNLTCFAHSPTDAIFAAATFMANVGLPGRAEPTLRAMTLPGPSQEAGVKNLTANAPTEAPKGLISGYRVVSYGPTAARVGVAMTISDGSQDVYAGMTVDLTWAQGDWKVVLTPTGTFPSGEPQGLTSLDGYAVWFPPNSEG